LTRRPRRGHRVREDGKRPAAAAVPAAKDFAPAEKAREALERLRRGPRAL